MIDMHKKRKRKKSLATVSHCMILSCSDYKFIKLIIQPILCYRKIFGTDNKISYLNFDTVTLDLYSFECILLVHLESKLIWFPPLCIN